MGFDEKTRLLGYVEKAHNPDHGRITVIGFKDQDGKYKKITTEEAKQNFQPEGKIFAPNYYMTENNDTREDIFLEFSMVQNHIEAQNPNHDIFIINYENKKTVILLRLITYTISNSIEKKYISLEGLNENFDKNIFENRDSAFLFKHEKFLLGLFEYNFSKNEIKPVLNKEVNKSDFNKELEIIKDKKSFYLSTRNDFNQQNDGVPIDCMSNQQLGDWFKKKLQNTTAVEIEQINNFLAFIKESSGMNDYYLDEVRFSRINEKKDFLEWTVEEIQDLLKTESNVFQNIVDHVELKKTEFQAQWLQTLSTEKVKYEAELANLQKQKEAIVSEIDALKNQENEVSKQIENSKKELEELTTNYDSIVSTIKIQNRLQEPIQVFKKQKITTFDEFPVLEKSFDQLEDECYGFSNILHDNVDKNSLPDFDTYFSNQSPLFTKQAVFIPCVSWAYVYAKAIRNSRVYVLPIEHDWLHYSDFCEHGLLQIWNTAHQHTEINFVLVLQKINVTSPECGLMPLLDVINGYRPTLSGTEIDMPQNLKIFATVVPTTEPQKIGLPLIPETFKHWGAVASPASNEFDFFLPKRFLEDTETKHGCYMLPNNMAQYYNSETTEELEIAKKAYYEF